MAAVMTMMGRGSDWATAKKALGEGNFLTQVLSAEFNLARKFVNRSITHEPKSSWTKRGDVC